MEQLKHECGIVMVRLLKPLSYYQKKYGSWQYGLNKLYLMMEKQHNRGQEGAGISCVKLDVAPGSDYMFREKALGSSAITEVFQAVGNAVNANSEAWKGELLICHLRYSTTGKSGLTFVHPFLRRNNWRAKNLCICGNFNMTNVDEVFADITRTGQHPRIYSDTYIMLAQVGHRLDSECERLFVEATAEKKLEGTAITEHIERNIRMENVLKTAAPLWDGGYVVCGQTGSGEMFAMRDPHGIRPCFYYKYDEILVITSERPAIQTALNADFDSIHELTPGHAIIVSKKGDVRQASILPQANNQACSFERIYFSRGSDRDIYQERKMLGQLLRPQILKAIDNDVENTVFSFIPNTAEVAFYGMLRSFKDHLNEQKIKQIEELGHTPTHEELCNILSVHIRSEKVAIKDIKLRTFITESNSRNDLAAHVYDITYGSLRPYKDNLVIIDDSIVRGTTLKESIIRILDRLHPKKIVIVSSSPQVRYPDYYGIDMAHMEEFIAFRAAVELINETGQERILRQVYDRCKEQVLKYEWLMQADLQKAIEYKNDMVNHVKDIYRPFTTEQISQQMVKMLKTQDIESEVELVFQDIEGLHKACPNHPGDWYFTGNYPTPGGTLLVSKAFMQWYDSAH